MAIYYIKILLKKYKMYKCYKNVFFFLTLGINCLLEKEMNREFAVATCPRYVEFLELEEHLA